MNRNQQKKRKNAIRDQEPEPTPDPKKHTIADFRFKKAGVRERQRIHEATGFPLADIEKALRTHRGGCWWTLCQMWERGEI